MTIDGQQVDLVGQVNKKHSGFALLQDKTCLLTILQVMQWNQTNILINVFFLTHFGVFSNKRDQVRA